MCYKIKSINHINDINRCETFYIDHFQWRSICTPAAGGQLGFSKNKDFIVHLFCNEKDPKTDYCHHFDPVYKDSALEAFFQFDIDRPEYFNFEFNSSGACIAAFGNERFHRIKLTEQEITQLNIHSSKTADRWEIIFFIPNRIINRYQPHRQKQNTKMIRCNFYKLSEHPEIEHYGCFSPINLPDPDFHCIDFFKNAVIL